MNQKNVGLGILLVTVGIIWLFFSLDILPWSVLMNSLFTLWPLLLVAAGVSVIFRSNPIVRVGTWIVLLGVLIGYGLLFGDKVEEKITLVDDEQIVVEKRAEILTGNADFDLGGATLRLGSDDSALLQVVHSGLPVEHNVKYDNGNTHANVKVNTENNPRLFIKNPKSELDIALNKDVTWNIDLDVGAVNGTLDLSDLMVEKVDMDSGAVNMDLIFGSRLPQTFFKIDAGASNIDVIVPKDAGVKLNMDGVIKNTQYSGLNMVDKGSYSVSENYDTAAVKIDLDVDMGVGKFSVTAR